jgi:hypothetical protein
MIFRQPVDFLRSYHLQMLKNAPPEGETVRDLGEAIRLEPERRAGRKLPPGCLVPELLTYATDRLLYEEHFDRFASRFPPEQILALVYDDFRADNPGTVRRVFEFLDVDPSFRPHLEEHNTGGEALRSRRLQSLLRWSTHSGGAVARMRTLLPQKLRRRAIRGAYSNLAFIEPPPLSPDLITELRAKAKPHIEALGERLGRDLVAEWGYSDVGDKPASPAA